MKHRQNCYTSRTPLREVPLPLSICQYCDVMFQTMLCFYHGYTWWLLEYLDTGCVEATLHTLALNRDDLVTEDTDTEGGWTLFVCSPISAWLQDTAWSRRPERNICHVLASARHSCGRLPSLSADRTHRPGQRRLGSGHHGLSWSLRIITMLLCIWIFGCFWCFCWF